MRIIVNIIKKRKGKGILRQNKSVINKADTAGITLIALVITIIVLLILAGVTINTLLGSDSVPAKANEAAQKNAIGEAKDDVQLTAINAQATGYKTAYVGDSVSAGSASNIVGKTVVKALYDKYGASKTMGKATISVTPTGSIDASDLNAITGGTVTVYTTDFEVIGTVEMDGGVINWEEISSNSPSITLRAESSTTLAPGGTVQLFADFRKMEPLALEELTWKSSNESVATVNSSGLVKVDSKAIDKQEVNITATVNGITSSSLTITVKDKITVANCKPKTELEAVKPLTEKMNKTGNITIEDDNGKSVVVPEGFGIAFDSGNTIEEGIVIEDAFSTGDNDVRRGSQFVWIPIGQTLNIGNKTETIALSRYDFGSKVITSESKLDQKGAREDIEQAYSKTLKYYYAEDKLRDAETKEFSVGNKKFKNSVARDIDEFIDETIKAKGFYIGRYEMGKEDEKAVCKPKTDVWTSIVRGNVTISGDKITTTGAVKEARNMYGYQEKKFTSDLMNSFAWDSAIAFIEKCGTNSNYAFYLGTRTSKTATGSETNKDEQCKIFDMAGNVYEWTTESSNRTDYPCVKRGGSYKEDTSYTSYRYYNSTTHMSDFLGFRPILYILSDDI